MRSQTLFVLGLCLVASINAAATVDETLLEQGPYVEGDMIIPPDGEPAGYAGMINTRNRWPNGVIVYKFDSSLSSTAKRKVQQAMPRVTSETGNCIRFRQATSSDGNRYVKIQGSSGCSATVGYYGRTTEVNLSSGCSVGNIMHEFLHTLGIYHQQSRPDRDTYVTIMTANIQSGAERNFRRESSSTSSTFGISYDFGSIMHYGLTFFSKNGRRTIEPKPGKLPSGVRVGQRDKLSSADVRLIKKMYGC